MIKQNTVIKKFRKNIIQLRKKLKKRQIDVALFLNVSKQAYSNYETGKREPDFASLCQLAKYFGVSTDYLLGFQDEDHEAEIINECNFDDEDLEIIYQIKELPTKDRIIIDTILKLNKECVQTEKPP